MIHPYKDSAKFWSEKWEKETLSKHTIQLHREGREQDDTFGARKEMCNNDVALGLRV